ncbi:hypothetical protein ACIPWE_40315 [Streptomyces sp. NPDC090073]|uniref:hypothetical protein n=1 Tax=Streptomyces sp. NPDC090073 TaxID=3365936 RepID=UPI00382E2B29
MASRGTGNSFGRALINAIAAAAGGTVGVRRSYTAKGWHAQISKLTSSPRGYEAAEKAGISVTARTLKAWLAEDVEPNADNQRRIGQAYRIMAGYWPEQVERQSVDIIGEVSIGDDVRHRGGKNTAALTIDGSAGDWRRMREAWEDGDDPDPGDYEEWFVEDILEADLGEWSVPPEFTGSDYTVIIG